MTKQEKQKLLEEYERERQEEYEQDVLSDLMTEHRYDG